MPYRIIGFILLFFNGFIHAAEVYQWIDAQGHRHYSDKKQANATPLKLTRSFSYHRVKKVYDGDTIRLSDGRKIRLLGINTPEIEHSGQAAQAGGDSATKWLTQQLLGTKVRLEFDHEKRDKYKRHLAHIFTQQDVHINYELVRRGFASTNVFPPNLKYVTQLHAAEQAAEAENIGIWRYPDYQTKLTGELNKSNKQGWQRIVGRIIGIKNTRKSSYLKLSGHFDVRIKKEHHQYFANLSLLKGKKVEVRGWVHKYKNGFSMLLKHPSAIKILE